MLPLRDIIGQFEGVGLTAADAMTIFGQRAGPAMLTLVQQGSGALENLTQEMINSGGTAKRIAETQLNTFQGQITLLKSGAEGLALAIGEGLVPTLRPLVEQLTKIVQGVVQWAEEHPRWFSAIVAVTTIMGGLALAMGGLLLVVGLLIPAITTLGLTLVLATGGIILAIGLVVTAGVLLYQNWDKVQEVGERVWTAILQAVQNAVNWIIEGINSLLKVYAGMARKLLDGATLIAGVFGVELPEGIDKFVSALESGIPKVDFYDQHQRQLAESALEAAEELAKEADAVKKAEKALETQLRSLTDLRGRSCGRQGRPSASAKASFAARKADEELEAALISLIKVVEDDTSTTDELKTATGTLRERDRQCDLGEQRARRGVKDELTRTALG